MKQLKSIINQRKALYHKVQKRGGVYLILLAETKNC